MTVSKSCAAAADRRARPGLVPLGRRDFRFRLLAERERTDRNEVPFSLLVFRLPRSAGRGEGAATRVRDAIARTMRDELTVIDELGWLGRRRLGLLLPGTTALEAAELAGRLPFRPLAETYPIESDADGQSAADGVLGEILYRPPPFWKRSLDMVGALVGIVLLSPLLFGVVLLIKLGSRGPVFYRQQRAGARGRPFEMWKFRTMCSSVDASIHQAHVSQQMQANGTMSKLDHQQPLIPLGKTLRALGLDELPQLVNILRGDMSLVGPRPDVISYADYKPWQRRRFDVLPGITGLWQVNGKNDTTFEEMVRMDTQYAEHRSLQLDLWILLVTIPTVLRQCRLLD